MIKFLVKSRVIHNTTKGTIDGAERAVLTTAVAIEGQAKTNAPVDTGILRASITRAVSGLEGVVGSNVEYAVYQEEGTRKMPAANQGQGYLKPAVESVRRKLTAIFGKNIRIGIRRS